MDSARDLSSEWRLVGNYLPLIIFRWGSSEERERREESEMEGGMEGWVSFLISFCPFFPPGQQLLEGEKSQVRGDQERLTSWQATSSKLWDRRANWIPAQGEPLFSPIYVCIYIYRIYTGHGSGTACIVGTGQLFPDYVYEVIFFRYPRHLHFSSQKNEYKVDPLFFSGLDSSSVAMGTLLNIFFFTFLKTRSFSKAYLNEDN